MKKIFCFMLAIVFCFSLSLSVYADEALAVSEPMMDNIVFDNNSVYDLNSEDVVVYNAAWFYALRSSTNWEYEAHYTTNLALEGNSLGYIYGQKNCPAFVIGSSNMASVGCGMAAVYNALKFMGAQIKVSSIIRTFEKNGYLMLHGYLGSDPFAIAEYLDNNNFNYTQYTDFSDMEDAVNEGMSTRQAYIISRWNGTDITDGLHTFALYTTESGNGVHVYNLYDNSTGVRDYNDIGDFVDDDTFVVGYVIPRFHAK